MSIQPDTGDRYVELPLECALLRVGDHVAVFYRGDAERDAFVGPLVAAALAADCGLIYVCDGRTPQRVAAQMAGSGDDVEDAMARDQIRIVSSQEVYLAGGRFDPRRTVEFYSGEVARSIRAGYPVTCVVGEMSWSLRGCPGTERLVDYEALYAEEFDAAPGYHAVPLRPRADPRRATVRPAAAAHPRGAQRHRDAEPVCRSWPALRRARPAALICGPRGRPVRSEWLGPVLTVGDTALAETVAGLNAVVMLGSCLHAAPSAEDAAELAAGGLAAP